MTGTRRILPFTLLVVSCAVLNPRSHDAPRDPDAESAAIRAAWNKVRSDEEGNEQPGRMDREEQLLDQAESLALEYPKHEPSLMLCAGLSYALRRPERSRAYLDSILNVDPAHADAATLRARIAIEAGSVPYATGLLERTIELRPDHAGLRETLASAYYLSDRPKDALDVLDAAERLGAPAFRIAYNRGLIAEGEGRVEEAAGHYRDALAARPGWPPAQRRLAGLGAATNGER